MAASQLKSVFDWGRESEEEEKATYKVCNSAQKVYYHESSFEKLNVVCKAASLDVSRLSSFFERSGVSVYHGGNNSGPPDENFCSLLNKVSSELKNLGERIQRSEKISTGNFYCLKVIQITLFIYKTNMFLRW
ncbi:hypothetical protein [endosymbiont GvMRE of Glomus versiforme]|uniref:hypothetical protein n=1 Tax=endosymbiont GvMRE of Glomus versiforme TaxID=2039283 RepID=UPI000EE6659C|nr:hypothetical protein [endosymbiont GvMRE of Glomus versiforme]RHZ35181.1 hypothetical protein GvMRE_IIg52 [endosymbiont GvMRE of Glomus versiforme]